LNRRQPTQQQGGELDSQHKALTCARLAAAKKASDLVVMDVSRLTSIADFFVICNGRSDRQVQSIAQAIEEHLGELGLRPLAVEGYQRGQWVLMDFNDVVVHIFYTPVREFYDLDRLWAEAPRLQVPEQAASPPHG